LGGKPCIRGTRISVEFILELIASGGTAETIVAAYPMLTAEDVEQAVRIAAESLRNDFVLTAEVVT
jgi:uncharacterized protein (DUF433 family)